MSRSSLCSGYVPASTSNYTQGRKGYKVCKITPHHMAGVLSGEQCARIFQRGNRGASANYCIGNDGDIVCSVEEENRAWTSSNRANDCQAITIEVSNSSVGGDYPISEKAWNSLVNLCVDICKRYNFKLVYDGTPNGSLTRHNMFANTNCPGKYLQSRFQELADTVNSKLDNSTAPAPTTPTSNVSEYKVKVTTGALNIRSGVGTGNPVVGCIRDEGVYTIVETQGNWGKLKSGAGWICLDYTSRNTNSTSAKVQPSSTSSVYVLGKYVVNTPAGLNVRSGAGTNFGIKKAYPNGTRFDTYEIRGEWARTPSGWVNLRYCKLVNKY